jgi:hypothetical protein
LFEEGITILNRHTERAAFKGPGAQLPADFCAQCCAEARSQFVQLPSQSFSGAMHTRTHLEDNGNTLTRKHNTTITFTVWVQTRKEQCAPCMSNIHRSVCFHPEKQRVCLQELARAARWGRATRQTYNLSIL